VNLQENEAYENHLKNIAICRDKFIDIVVPFYVPHDNVVGSFDCFGSGFIIQRSGDPFIITAAHVIRDVAKRQDSSRILTIINGEELDITGSLFVVNDKFDLAVTVLENNNISNIKSIIVDGDDFGIQETAVAYGFPATSNKLGKFNLKRHLLMLGIDLSYQDDTGIFYNYNKKKIITESGENKGTGQDLHGMSGGPILSIHQDVGHNITMSLAGIITGQDPQNKLLIATRVHKLAEFIDRALSAENI
jgi:hypothetical protein